VLTIEDMAQSATMTNGAAKFLRAIMKAKLSCCVIGRTASGKTTLANALLASCENSERVVICEDTQELEGRPSWMRLISRAPGRPNGNDGVGLAELVRQALRLRGDRLVVGEVRGAEMGALLQADNAILFTLHAHDVSQAIGRMETLALMDVTLSVVPSPAYIRLLLSDTLTFIIQVGQVRVKDAREWRLCSISEVCGLIGGEIAFQEILRYEEKRPIAQHPCGTGMLRDGMAVFHAYPRHETLKRLSAACPDFDFARDVAEAGEQ